VKSDNSSSASCVVHLFTHTDSFKPWPKIGISHLTLLGYCTPIFLKLNFMNTVRIGRACAQSIVLPKMCVVVSSRAVQSPPPCLLDSVILPLVYTC
jgi:hypothetical protein